MITYSEKLPNLPYLPTTSPYLGVKELLRQNYAIHIPSPNDNDYTCDQSPQNIKVKSYPRSLTPRLSDTSIIEQVQNLRL